MNPFKFSSIYTFIPVAYIFLFIPQSVIGIFYLGGNAAYVFLEIICLGMLAYFLGYRSYKSLFKNKATANIYFFGLSGKKIATIAVCIFSAYFLVLLYAVMTAEKIPLWEALSGRTALQIAESRELLFHARTGAEKLLIYFYSILTCNSIIHHTAPLRMKLEKNDMKEAS